MPSPADVGPARAMALGVPLALLGGAYVAQYVFGLAPCEMCWWQRYGHFAALALALLAFVLPWRRALVLLAGLAILVAGLIGGFHAGVEYRWWQGLTACTGITGSGSGDLWEQMRHVPIVRCDVAPWDLFGISLAGWNFLFSVAGAVAVFALLRRRGRGLS